MVRSSSSNPPLSVGNVVSVAVRLYRSHLQQYLGISLQAVLWYLAVFGVLLLYTIVVSIIAAAAGQAGQVVTVLVGLVLLIPLVFFGLYFAAKSLANTALISRLAYSDLASQPETETVARSAIKPRTWGFFRIAVILFGINLVINLAGGIVTGVVEGIFGAESSFGNLLNAILNLVILAISYWVLARLFVPEVSLALENIKPMDAVKRSWELSKGAVGRVLLIIVVASLITLPLYILAFLPFIFTLLANITVFAGFGVQQSGAAIASILGSLAVSVLLLLALGIFITPFWQAIKAVIFYDLRNRREGADLQLRGGNPDR